MSEPRVMHLLTQHGGGSTMLCNMLDNHPQINCKHEAAENFNDVGTYLKILKPRQDVVLMHQHYTYINNWDMFKGHKVILLERLDNVCGAIKSNMFGHFRPAGWEYPTEFIKHNTDLRYERYREMEKIADKHIILEEIAPTFIDHLSIKDTFDICNFLGVEIEPLICTATRNRTDDYLPVNMGELYASANS